MRSFILATAAFALGAVAGPTLQKRDCNDTCMTYDQATQVANNFGLLISGYTVERANTFLTEQYTDYTDGVKTLIDSGCTAPLPLDGSPTFTGRAAFEAGQGSQPNITFDILNMWYACEGPVVLRWKSPQNANANPPFAEQVTGNIVAEVVRGSGSEPWLINTTYSEFNSGAWLVDLGVFKPNCSAEFAPKNKRSLKQTLGMPHLLNKYF